MKTLSIASRSPRSKGLSVESTMALTELANSPASRFQRRASKPYRTRRDSSTSLQPNRRRRPRSFGARSTAKKGQTIRVRHGLRVEVHLVIRLKNGANLDDSAAR